MTRTAKIQDDKRFRAWLNDLAQATECNDHSGAVVTLVSQYPEVTGQFVERAKFIKAEHTDLGHMPVALRLQRDELHDYAMEALSEAMSIAMYAALEAAY